MMKFLLRGVLLFILLLIAGYLALIIYITSQKSRLIQDISNKMAKEVNGNVIIGDIELTFFKNFPHISVLLKDIEIQDRFYARHKHRFLESHRLFLELDPAKLIKKEFSVQGIKIDKAQFYIYTDSSGYTNSYLFKSKPSTGEEKNAASLSRINLQRLDLKNVDIIYDDEAGGKLFNLHISNMDIHFQDTDSTLNLSVTSDLLIEKLLFTQSNTSLLENSEAKGDFDLLYDKQMKKIYSDSMDLKIGGQPFNLNLQIDLNSSAPIFHLKVNKGSIPFASLKSIWRKKRSVRIPAA